MSLTPQALQCIERRSRKRRVQVVETPDGLVVVKEQRAPRRRIGYRVLDAFSAITGTAAIKGVPAHGGAQAQAIELRRLRELADAGVPVPRVLHVAPGHLVLEHVPGPELIGLMRQAEREPGRMLRLWRAGLDALAQVHAHGQYLSQAFARNMLCCGGHIYRIDFEDDPLEVMSLTQAQARDWLTYLQSSSWLLPRDPALLDTWAAGVGGEPRPVVGVLARAARRLGWLRHLPKQGRPWGREVAETANAIDFLNAWAKRLPAP